MRTLATTRIIGIGVTTAVVIIVAAWGIATLARRADLNAQRDTVIAQFGAQTRHDEPCAQGVRRAILLVNFPAQLTIGGPGDLLSHGTLDVISADQSISTFYSTTFGTARVITPAILPELLPPNPSFEPMGNRYNIDTLQIMIRNAGEVIVNTSDEGNATELRYGGCLSAENQALTAAYRAILGDRLLLTGWTLAPNPARDEFILTLNWHVQAPDLDNVGILVRLLDTAGNIVSESRGYPLAGTSPSRLWRLGDQWRDVHVIRMKDSTTLSGNYRALVGLYTMADGQLLHAFDAAGKRIPGDMVAISTAKE